MYGILRLACRWKSVGDYAKLVGSRCTSNDASTSQLKNDIIQAATDFIPEYGWTYECVAAGAQSIGLSGSAHGLFPDPAKSLVLGFNNKCNRNLEEILNNNLHQQISESDTTLDKLDYGLWLRLEMLEPIIPEWAQALAILAHPRCIQEELTLSMRMVDTIWFYAGDRSTNFDWYRKRVSLLGIYKSTELFMVQDMSTDFEDTRKFLDRRLHDAQICHSAIKKVESFRRNSGEVGKAALATALNLLKIDSRPLYQKY